jgi:hypothetical protein
LFKVAKKIIKKLITRCLSGVNRFVLLADDKLMGLQRLAKNYFPGCIPNLKCLFGAF